MNHKPSAVNPDPQTIHPERRWRRSRTGCTCAAWCWPWWRRTTRRWRRKCGYTRRYTPHTVYSN